MGKVLSLLEQAVNAAYEILWGPPLVLLLLGTGLWFTLRLGFFQVRKAPRVARETLFSLLRRPSPAEKKAGALSPLQAMSTALAAAIGTGNIAGVAAAITLGGPGAVFWMWVSAFFGMMTGYAENVLGALYRRRGPDGAPRGGAMYYIRDGLAGVPGLRRVAKPLALAFALACALASLGIGNMAQVNAIAASLDSAFSIPPLATGLVTALLTGLVLLGGVRRIGGVAEKLVPVMALGYMAAAIAVLVMNIEALPRVLGEIFSGAFGLQAAAGGFSGAALKKALSTGVRRGVFSNEAGLGSSVMAHGAAGEQNPVRQGMWSIFEVFFDTVVLCSLTAFAILVTDVAGSVDAAGELVDGAPLVQLAFAQTFHQGAGAILGLAVALFAFATLLGWSYYGMSAVEYALGRRAKPAYRALFLVCIVLGAVMKLELVWTLSDLFNGLMALPNLLAVLALSGTVLRATKEEKDKGCRKR